MNTCVQSHLLSAGVCTQQQWDADKFSYFLTLKDHYGVVDHVVVLELNFNRHVLQNCHKIN